MGKWKMNDKKKRASRNKHSNIYHRFTQAARYARIYIGCVAKVQMKKINSDIGLFKEYRHVVSLVT